MPIRRPADDRRRDPPPDDGAWADTRPACFRSEAFAEDLPAPPPLVVVDRHPPPRTLPSGPLAGR